MPGRMVVLLTTDPSMTASARRVASPRYGRVAKISRIGVSGDAETRTSRCTSSGASASLCRVRPAATRFSFVATRA